MYNMEVRIYSHNRLYFKQIWIDLRYRSTNLGTEPGIVHDETDFNKLQHR